MSEIGFLQVGTVQIGGIEGGAAEVGAMQVGVMQVRPLQVGAAQVGFAQIAAVQVGAQQFAAAQRRSVQIGAMQVGIAEQRVVQVDVVQVTAVQIGTFAAFPARGYPLQMAVEDRKEIGRDLAAGEARVITPIPITHPHLHNPGLLRFRCVISARGAAFCQRKHDNFTALRCVMRSRPAAPSPPWRSSNRCCTLSANTRPIPRLPLHDSAKRARTRRSSRAYELHSSKRVSLPTEGPPDLSRLPSRRDVVARVAGASRGARRSGSGCDAEMWVPLAPAGCARGRRSSIGNREATVRTWAMSSTGRLWKRARTPIGGGQAVPVLFKP
ncbi:MAG: hypothetical protein U1E33_00590 [Rhodospirillales bacterium]